MKREESFLFDTERYLFDFRMCTTAKGYAQVDTSQDASYFGTWASPKKRQVITFAEGDLTVETAANDNEFAEAILSLKAWNEKQGWKFIGIDPGFNEDLKTAFIDIGLGELLH